MNRGRCGRNYSCGRFCPCRIFGHSGAIVGHGVAAIASKIKAKMVLDDYVKTRSIAVGARAGTVTLRGVVRSVAEHLRAITLANDTAGVTTVIDDLRVEKF